MTSGGWIVAAAVLALPVGLVMVFSVHSMRQHRGLRHGQIVALDNLMLVSER